MINAISTGASSLAAHNRLLNVASNNLSNVNTNGFQASQVNLQDVGAGGVAVGSISRDQSPGPLQVTGNQLDFAITGAGFLQVQQPDGTAAFARDGSLAVNADGQLVTSQGLLVQPPINIPPEATGLSVASDGTVSATLPGNQEPQAVGNLTLARFPNPQGLSSLGGNLFGETGASGAPQVDIPGAGGFGSIEQGVVEGSNVNIVSELTSLLLAQRGFEVGTRVIQAGDELFETTIDMIG